MKRYFIIYIIACLACIGCSEKFDEGIGLYPTLTPRYLTVSPTSMSFAAKPSEAKTMNITSTETPWKIDNGIEWVSLSSTSGSSTTSVNVSVSENTVGDNARAGIFYFKSDVSDWKYETPISITQSGAIPTINLSKTEIEFTGKSNRETVTVTANCDWDAKCSSDWLTVTVENNLIHLSSSSNETDSYRSAIVSVSHSGTTNVSSAITVRQAPASITASTESVIFNNTASSIDLTINSDAPWTASTSASWIELSASSGNAGSSILKISVSPNTSVSERKGYVVLSVGNAERIQIPIVQRGIYITTDTQNLTFIASGESKTISISSNTSWMIAECPSWITVSQNSGTGDASVTITASDNQSVNPRSAIIKVKQDGLNIVNSISLEQDGKMFDVSPQVLSFEDGASSQSFQISAEDNWTISNDNNWITVSSMSGSGNTNISVGVTDNEKETERQGTIFVTMLDKTISVKIAQKGKVFTISTETTNLYFPAVGGESKLAVTCNTKWILSSYPSWVTVSKVQGIGNAEIVFIAEENPNASERSANAALQIEGKTDALSILLLQYGKSFSVTPASLDFTDKGGSQDITIETDGAWSASSNAAWISLSPTSASGNSTLKVTVAENTSDSERNGTVSITMGDKTLSVSVSQKGKYLTISNNLLTYTSKGGNIVVSITSNDSWKTYVEDGSSWISLSETSGTGNVDIKVTAADNPSVNKRTAAVIVETINGKSVRIVVTQDARYLTISNNSVQFYAKGGTSEAISVSTDGAYEIKCSDSWFSVNQSGNSFTVTATENMGEPRTGTITISLTDLKEGTYSLTLDVIQLNNGGSFFHNGYNDDINYDNQGGTNSITLSVTGYGSDNNYDSSSHRAIVIGLTGYQADSNWDNSGNNESGVNPTVNGYGDDKDYDTSNQSGIDLGLTGFQTDINYDNENANGGVNSTVNGYGNDKDYDSSTTNGITLTITGYQTENSYDTTSSSKITVTVTGYNNDKSYDSSTSSSGNISVDGYNADTNHDSSNSSTGNITKNGYGNDNDWDK